MHDPLYYSRRPYADALLTMLAEGVVSAFTLFAPRRMGKTQFLLNDIQPAAEARDFAVFYFSFMDSDAQTENRFRLALLDFASQLGIGGKLKAWLAGIEQLSAFGASLSREKVPAPASISEVIEALAQGGKRILLLLDEVQELARLSDTGGLIRSLRTGLDVHRAQVKVIFTGSSMNGLRQMFSDYKAPFFQFAHAMAFPRLEQEFTDFLADIYQVRTANTLDKQALYQWLVRFEHIPLHLRTIIQNMIIDPTLPLDVAAAAQQQYLHDSADYAAVWRELKALDRLLLQALAQEKQTLYAQDTRQWLAAQMGVDDVSVPQVQAALRRLTRADFITKNSEGQWAVNHPDMLGWIREQL